MILMGIFSILTICWKWMHYVLSSNEKELKASFSLPLLFSTFTLLWHSINLSSFFNPRPRVGNKICSFILLAKCNCSLNLASDYLVGTRLHRKSCIFSLSTPPQLLSHFGGLYMISAEYLELCLFLLPQSCLTSSPCHMSLVKLILSKTWLS